LAIGDPFAVTNPTGVVLIWPGSFVFATWVASYFRLSVRPEQRSILPSARPGKIGAGSEKYWTVQGFWPAAAHLEALRDRAGVVDAARPAERVSGCLMPDTVRC